jgi:glycerol-3-phosphate dehydrogenase
MIPKTDDGRVLFAIPWHAKVIIGTTDTVVDHIDTEPKALDQEIEFILRTSARYLSIAPTKADILSVFAGLRPLAAPTDKMKSTREISRSHKLIVSESGLITIIGGKWTTYRRMAEDTLKIAIREAKLPNTESKTKIFRIQGYEVNGAGSVYGSDSKLINALIINNPDYGERIHPDYEYLFAHVIWAVREEMARTLEDVLARRLRMLFLDAKASIEIAPKVARCMAMELHYDKNWEVVQIEKFGQLAAKYMIVPINRKYEK